MAAPTPRPRGRKRPADRSTPRPEIIDGGAWTVEDSPNTRHAHVGWDTGTDSGGEMMTPNDDSPQARCVRAHELQHVAITPRDHVAQSEGLPNVIVQHVEDARVHAHLTANGFDLMPMAGIMDDRELTREAIEAMPRPARASIIAATYGTGEFDRVYGAIYEIDQGATRVGYKAGQLMHHEHRPDFAETVRVARYILAALPGGDDAIEERLTYFDPDEIERAMTDDELGDNDGLRDVRMDITTPRLTRPIPDKWRTNTRRRISTSGRRLRRPGRLYRDGMIFADRVKRPGGGATLIDTSGSMHLEPWEIDALMAAYPAGIVATYAGTDDHGELRIVARDGKRVANDHDLAPTMGGNVIDVPALRWLEKQTGPRYWVSDAGVGGAAELMECGRICRRADIERVDRAGDIVGMRTE